MNVRPRALVLLAPPPVLSRFDAHREEVAQRTTLELASEMTKRAADSAAKAASLMGTASALPARREALRGGPDGWQAALREAQALLAEVLGEMER